MYAVTGATGQLGRLVVKALLRSVPAGEIVAIVRDPSKAADLAADGVVVREADYDRQESLPGALAGVSKLLLISANQVGRRAPQHRAVIDAAVTAGVELIAYTSILHCDRSPLTLADEHKATEKMLLSAGIPAVLLRNGWYTENYLGNLPQAVERGEIVGAAGSGRVSLAARADYADAAAAALSRPTVESRTYELAGDDAYTLPELAAEVAAMTGKPFVYRNLSQADYKAMLLSVGLPAPLSAILADAEAQAGHDALFDGSKTLGQLIGRPTTPLRQSLAAALGTP